LKKDQRLLKKVKIETYEIFIQKYKSNPNNDLNLNENTFVVIVIKLNNCKLGSEFYLSQISNVIKRNSSKVIVRNQVINFKLTSYTRKNY
jgi:hypothetical protein